VIISKIFWGRFSVKLAIDRMLGKRKRLQEKKSV
jgi:hypothetical protein